MSEDTTSPTTQSHRDTFLRVVAIIGLIAVIMLGAWGIIQIAFNLPTFLGSIGNKTESLFSIPAKTESVAVTLPPTAFSGEPFMISWTHENPPSGDFSYTISYSCNNELSVKAPTPTGIFQSVPCATPFNYTNATQNMQIVPMVSGSNSLSIAISVSAISLADGTVTATGSSTISILPSTSSGTTPVQTSTPPPSTSKPAVAKQATTATPSSNPYGVPDLAVQIISATPEGNGLTAVKFVVENVGTKVTPVWTFSASLPVGYPYTYYSPPQHPLYPGGKIISTLTFSGGSNNQVPYQNCYYPQEQYGYYPSYQNQNCYNTQPYATTGAVTITVDPSNLIYEINKANNTASITVPLTTY